MKVLLSNLTATSVEKDKMFYPAIDDGEKIYFFNSYIHGSRESAVALATGLIENLQCSLDNTVQNWHMQSKEK